MSDRAIDSALSELVQLRWSWEYEERSAARTKQIEEQAGRLAASAPGAHADFAKALADGMSDAPALEPPPRTVPVPEPEAETETPWTPVEALVSELPVDVDNVEEQDVEQLLVRASETEQPAAAPVRLRLPARNATTSTAAHVRLFTEHGGLVHGGVLTVGGSRLVCRAFSWFRHTTNRRLFGPGTSERMHTVAGVCEQFAASGAAVARFSTAEKYLTEMYRTTSQSLVDGAWRATSVLGAGEGFYATALTPRAALDLVRDAKTGRGVVMPDTGVPDPRLYGGSDRFFAVSPGPNAAPENALFLGRAFGSDAWVIKTPYLAVYSPDPRVVSPRPSDPHVPVIVAMLGVYRRAKWTTRGKGRKSVSTVEFERKAQWSVRSFRLPLPD